MLIPIGQEDSTVRRHPWVTYGLLALNVFFFLVTSATGPGGAWRNAVMTKIDEMVAYFNERPYLELPPDLVASQDPSSIALARMAHTINANAVILNNLIVDFSDAWGFYGAGAVRVDPSNLLFNTGSKFGGTVLTARPSDPPQPVRVAW